MNLRPQVHRQLAPHRGSRDALPVLLRRLARKGPMPDQPGDHCRLAEAVRPSNTPAILSVEPGDNLLLVRSGSVAVQLRVVPVEDIVQEANPIDVVGVDKTLKARPRAALILRASPHRPTRSTVCPG